MKYRIRATLDNETFEFNIYDHARWLALFYKTGGITLGKSTVFLKFKFDAAHYLNPMIIGHEAIHTRQAADLGWKYIPTYIIQAIKAKFVKKNIPMEQEAYSKQDKVFWVVVKTTHT